MFEVTYLFVLGVAALPMALTLLRANREKRVAFVRRLYRDSAYIAIAAVGIIGLETALSISLEHFTAFGFRLSTASKSFWQYCSWPAFLLAPICGCYVAPSRLFRQAPRGSRVLRLPGWSDC